MKVWCKITTFIVSLALIVLLIPRTIANADILPGNTNSASFSQNTFFIIQNTANKTCLQKDTDGIFMVEADSLSGNYYQQWDIIMLDYGYYAIVNAQTNEVLTAPSSNADGEPVNVLNYSSSLHDLQIWKFTQNSDGTYLIQSKAKEGTSLYLALSDNYSPAGNNVAIEQKTQSNANRWKLFQAADVVDTVPAYLISSNDHLCIPCAITNVAGHWSVSGYSGFGCATAAQQETQAMAISAFMQQLATNAHVSNDYIPAGFSYFSHTADDGITYGLSAQNQWKDDLQFTAIDIMEEIDAGKPLLLGYAGKKFFPQSPYSGGHMTVCAGYEWDGTTFYVHVSDAHQSYYVRNLFTPYTDNDFISKVSIAVKQAD